MPKNVPGLLVGRNVRYQCDQHNNSSCIFKESITSFYMMHNKCFLNSRGGMHNIRPAGQMWPAKAFNLARKAQI